MLPAGFHEGHDGVLDAAGIADRLLHQRRNDTKCLAARQPVHGFAVRRFVFGTQAFDVVVQRGLDIQQRAGHIEQGLLIGRAQAVGDLVEYAALFGDHAARYRQRQHAQGVTHPFEHFALCSQLRGVGILLAQEQIERFLDAQQIVFQCTRHGIEQGAVVPRHRATGMFQFARIRQQAVQVVGGAQLLHVRAALLGLGHEVKQFGRHFVRIARTEAVFPVFDQQADVAVDLADQLAHFGGLALEHALLQPFQHAGGDPPQAPAMHVMATRGDRQQGLAHADQLLCHILPAEPGQQLVLETQAQAGQLGAMRRGIRLAHGGGRLLGQERVQIGVEHRGLGQRLLAARAAQVVQQRQQHHRHVAVAAGKPLQVIRQLHQAAHQRGIGFLAMGYLVVHQGADQGFHLRRDLGRAIQLDHLQRAEHLMQMIRAGAHEIALVGIVDVGLQCLARNRQGIVEFRLDPLQRGEIDVVLKSHAPLSAVAPCRHGKTSETAPRFVRVFIASTDVIPAA